MVAAGTIHTPPGKFVVEDALTLIPLGGDLLERERLADRIRLDAEMLEEGHAEQAGLERVQDDHFDLLQHGVTEAQIAQRDDRRDQRLGRDSANLDARRPRVDPDPELVHDGARDRVHHRARIDHEAGLDGIVQKSPDLHL